MVLKYKSTPICTKTANINFNCFEFRKTMLKADIEDLYRSKKKFIVQSSIIDSRKVVPLNKLGIFLVP
jgi:hypothetical protein